MIRFVSNTPIQIYSWCPSASVMPIGFYRAMHFSPKRGHAITIVGVFPIRRNPIRRLD